MDWQLRSANPSDQAGLEDLIAESAAQRWGPDSIATAIAGAQSRVRLAEAPDGRPLGFVLARRILDLLEIDLVGVRPTHRRRGIARSMLSALLEEEAGRGLAEARLELAESNDPARGLYVGLEFVVVGRRTRYYPDGDDALLLSRPFSQGRSLPPE